MRRAAVLCCSARMPYFELTFKNYSLNLYYLSFLSSPPSLSKTYAVANEQGALEESQSTALIEQPTA